MDLMTKTYLSHGFALLAVFELWSAMKVFGGRDGNGPPPRVVLTLHRIGGYVFLLYAMLLGGVGLDMLERFYAIGGYDFDARKFSHTALAFLFFLLLLLKLGFIRCWRKYRPYVPLLGFIVTVLALLVWFITGWMFLDIMGGTKVAT